MSRRARPHPPPAKAGEPQAYQKFEAMVLQSFMQSMLPDNSDSVYGEGLSGDMWKGLLAQQLGTVMAERGGIGIARQLSAEHYSEGEAVRPLRGVTDIEAKAAADEQNRLSVAVVQEMQRRMAASVFEDRAASAAPATPGPRGVTSIGDAS